MSSPTNSQLALKSLSTRASSGGGTGTGEVVGAEVWIGAEVGVFVGAEVWIGAEVGLTTGGEVVGAGVGKVDG